MKKSMLTLLFVGCFVAINAPQFADAQGGEEVKTIEASVSPRNTSKATRTEDTWQLHSGGSTARLFVGSRANLHAFNISVARVSGTVFLDRTKPANNKIELVLYPADAGGPAGLDGKLASGARPVLMESWQVAEVRMPSITAS